MAIADPSGETARRRFWRMINMDYLIGELCGIVLVSCMPCHRYHTTLTVEVVGYPWHPGLTLSHVYCQQRQDWLLFLHRIACKLRPIFRSCPPGF